MTDDVQTAHGPDIDEQRVVSFHYRLSDGFGELIDSSLGGLPLVYLHNSGALLPSLEREFTGRRAGEAFEVVIYPEDGYGYASEERVTTVPRARFAGIGELHEGMRIKVQSDAGTELVTVTELGEDEVTVDANHPLAGKVLRFEVTVVAVRESTDEERAQGFATSTRVPGAPDAGPVGGG